MNLDKITAWFMATFGFFLILASGGSHPPRPELGIAGAILMGSWYIGRSIDRRNK
jgi:hypothetical protein